MQSFPQQQAVPTGPSVSSTSTRNSKLDQIIQNFYTKTAQIIVQARCTPNADSRYGKRSSLKGSSQSRKLNKWFNITTEDAELLREDLKFWRNSAVQSIDKEVPPMILDVYLDTRKLSHNQSLVVADDNLRWGRVELKSQTSDAHVDCILMESWELTLKHPFPDHAVDLPNLYKRSIVFFRSLHSLVRILPSYELYRKLHKLNDANPLSIGYRLSSTPVRRNTEIALESTILESDARKPTLEYNFTDIVTPIGTFKLNVTYRRNCDFKVEDSERDLSAQFIDMDEQFFTPTMAKYQQEYPRPRPVSAYSPREKTVEKEYSTSPHSRHPMDTREIQPSPRPPYSTTSRTSVGNNSDISTSARRSSAPFVVSPFKSPFLSSSPQAESLFSGANQMGSKNFTPPSLERSKGGVDSGSFGKKIEFSSSFDKYKASPTNRAESFSSNSMTRRWSRTSDHSSINFKANENDDDLEDFVRFVGSNQELRLFTSKNSSTQLLASGQNLSSESSADSVSGSMFKSTNKKAALSHFQNLRDTHTSLSESLTSSMMMGNASQHDASTATGASGISPVSSTSSTGRSYQPIIPSPLHVEQRSTSPVYIPRSFPQLRTLSSNQNAIKTARLVQPSHESYEDTNNTDMSAYSTYPQDNHHQDMHMMRNAATASNSNRILGKAIDTTQRVKSPTRDMYHHLQRSRNTDDGSSLLQDNSTDINSSGGGGGGQTRVMDDDDSLVFKMSELEGEGPAASPPKKEKQPMMFGMNTNTAATTLPQQDFLELTPTPLSPPLLHRLQAISMSTVNEEEEKSSSGGSSHGEPSPRKTRPNHRPFDAW